MVANRCTCLAIVFSDLTWIIYYCFSGHPAETGGAMISPRPSPDNSTPKPGFPMRPFFGIDPVIVDDKVGDQVNPTLRKLGG